MPNLSEFQLISREDLVARVLLMKMAVTALLLGRFSHVEPFDILVVSMGLSVDLVVYYGVKTAGFRLALNQAYWNWLLCWTFVMATVLHDFAMNKIIFYFVCLGVFVYYAIAFISLINQIIFGKNAEKDETARGMRG